MVCLTIHQLGQGCFQFLTIINKTDINIKKRIFLVGLSNWKHERRGILENATQLSQANK